MTDQTNEDQQVDNTGSGENVAQWRKDMEAQLRDAKDRASKAEKELTFNRVKGLDIENPQHKFFLENYKGEMNAEAIAKQASELGFIKAEADQQSQDAADQKRFDNASQGAAPADIQGSEEAKYNAILNGEFKSLQDYEAAVREIGGAKNLING